MTHSAHTHREREREDESALSKQAHTLLADAFAVCRMCVCTRSVHWIMNITTIYLGNEKKWVICCFLRGFYGCKPYTIWQLFWAYISILFSSHPLLSNTLFLSHASILFVRSVCLTRFPLFSTKKKEKKKYELFDPFYDCQSQRFPFISQCVFRSSIYTP